MNRPIFHEHEQDSLIPPGYGMASQAALWYNEAIQLLTGAMLETSARLRRILIGDASMDTLPPHALSGNIPNASGIYKITCMTNKKIYIGSAVNLRRRRYVHFNYLQQNKHPNRHLQAAWNKYGPDAFTFEVLELVLPMSLTAREQYWLNKLKPFGAKGFNIASDACSTLGIKHSPESIERSASKHRGKKQMPERAEQSRRASLGRKNTPNHNEKIRQAKLGVKRSLETREKLRLANLGKPGYKRSPETIEKLRKSLTGRKHTPESIERMRQAKRKRG